MKQQIGESSIQSQNVALALTDIVQHCTAPNSKAFSDAKQSLVAELEKLDKIDLSACPQSYISAVNALREQYGKFADVVKSGKTGIELLQATNDIAPRIEAAAIKMNATVEDIASRNFTDSPARGAAPAAPVRKYPNANARGWAAEQATGPPDAYLYASGGDYENAWASKAPDDQVEWLELTWDVPTEAAGVDVYETYNPGALIRVVAFNDNREVARWEGVDPTPRDAPLGKGISKIRFDKPAVMNRVRLTIDSPKVPGWNEIDAVGLVEPSGSVHWATGATASSSYAD
jgi:hypothetical protein